MIPLDEIALIRMADARVGQFLFLADIADRTTAFLKAETDGPPSLLRIGLENNKLTAEVMRATYTPERFITYGNTRLMADPNSVVHGTKCSPAFGTLLLTEKGPGILFENSLRLQAVFLLSGQIVETRWGQDTGFSRWQVESLDGDREPTLLLEVDAPPQVRGGYA